MTRVLVTEVLAPSGLDAMALLPDGEARVQLKAELNIESAGQKKHVTLYAVTGLDFSPGYVWLDGDKFFANVDDWGTIISEGWEPSVKTLLAAQQKVKDSRASELATKLAHHPSEYGIRFTHANVFDAESGKIIPDQTVVIHGNRIIQVGEVGRRDEGALDPPFETIDATNKTLLPGLWDMHAHVGDNDGLLNLAAGVTTGRQSGPAQGGQRRPPVQRGEPARSQGQRGGHDPVPY